MNRVNLGCGSVQPDDWTNADLRGAEYGCLSVDVSNPFSVGEFAEQHGRFDVVVANHLLSCFDHHDLPNVLSNIGGLLLAAGGTLRVLVPNMREAARAYLCGEANWFPHGDDMPSVSERF